MIRSFGSAFVMGTGVASVRGAGDAEVRRWGVVRGERCKLKYVDSVCQQAPRCCCDGGGGGGGGGAAF